MRCFDWPGFALIMLTNPSASQTPSATWTSLRLANDLDVPTNHIQQHTRQTANSVRWYCALRMRFSPWTLIEVSREPECVKAMLRIHADKVSHKGLADDPGMRVPFRGLLPSLSILIYPRAAEKPNVPSHGGQGAWKVSTVETWHSSGRDGWHQH
ncbi:hypothetical protein BDW68DRAFT_4870 [Aspergillus falconensis]